ncbi:pyridoxamine 5'-phosphate oxidase [Spirulina sp. CS-785/01]|uniref:pyridoxamine 5'-phosphate oxidase n=1 Tax=Spirulina sp. CS-785/01 TaxID=3021716 RepID=UPI00232D994C|nr:pyridoxamine 5'-phosphate oxidase [Spirulina sp. CS-785/01]MDB9313435.1 pyridoxamine 5'-phosphate oxidase [Spirulina sp. CS-785/01]
MNISVADLRQNYTKAGLHEQQAQSNPFHQFKTWFDQALKAQLPEPNAMTLATATPDGKPSARMVLLKDFDEQGFTFYTNYNSVKGQQLIANPWASLVFWWVELERQVRIEGRVEKLSPQESDTYFHSRPLGSQLGAWASEQSRAIPSQDFLEKQLAQYQQKYANQTIPRPPHWGGFRVIPVMMEFWQGRPNRLHDRLCYRLDQQGMWQRERLSP